MWRSPYTSTVVCSDQIMDLAHFWVVYSPSFDMITSKSTSYSFSLLCDSIYWILWMPYSSISVSLKVFYFESLLQCDGDSYCTFMAVGVFLLFSSSVSVGESGLVEFTFFLVYGFWVFLFFSESHACICIHCAQVLWPIFYCIFYAIFYNIKGKCFPFKIWICVHRDEKIMAFNLKQQIFILCHHLLGHSHVCSCL